MYTEKGKRLSKAAFVRLLKEKDRLYIEKDWYTREEKRAEITKEQFSEMAGMLKDLNDAMLDGRTVKAVCDKEPRGDLDTGRHYYSVYYTNRKGHVLRMYPAGGNLRFAHIFGFGKYTKDRSIPYWVFSSGAIGMSRLLDATDSLFARLKDMGGCYAQIDVF
jgi:hypothetical protein